MDSLSVKITLEPTWFNDPPKITIAANGEALHDGEITDTMTFEQTVDFPEDSENQLTITLHDKGKYDTEVVNGEIVRDTLVKITAVSIDNVDITGMLPLHKDLFYYKHDNNGSTELIVDHLYDTMGCNGSAVINFTTPFYVWLLENL